MAWLRRIATALAVAAVAEALGILLISAAGDARFQVGFDLATIGFLGSVLLFPVVGALIIQRRPSTRVAWLMILIGLGLGFGLLTFGYGTIGMPPGQPLPLALELLVLSQLFFVPTLGCGAAVLLLLFPTDRLIDARWAVVMVVAAIGAFLYEVGTIFAPGELEREAFPGLQNPLGAPAGWAPLLDFLAGAGNALVTLSIVLGALSVIVRYRRADLVEAAQIRWLALVAGFASVSFAISALRVSVWGDVAFGIGLVLLACMPIAIGIAITRYHLYDIDRLINRALVYASLTAILAGIFTAAIGFAQRLFVAVTGEASDAAIVLTTLVVATLYAPLRKQLEAIVDRRFKYEQHRFGAYRDEVDKLLSILEPGRAAERLAAESVRELAATGGAVVDAQDQPTATAGEWPVPPVVRLPIPGGSRGFDAILIGPCMDGRPHDPRSIIELQDVAGMAAAAVRSAGTAAPKAPASSPAPAATAPGPLLEPPPNAPRQ
jgi:hypothetical protein